MIILSEQQLDEALDLLATSEYIAFDFETMPSGAYPDVDKQEASIHHKMLAIEGLALRSEKLEPIYIPFQEISLSRIALVEKLRKLFSQDSLFIAHNIQFDAKVTAYFLGARPKNKFCTLVGYWYLDENVPKDAKTLGKKHFDLDMISYDEAKKLPKEDFYEYAKRDAQATYLLYFFLKEKLSPKHFDLASTLEMEFVDVLIDMTLRGIACDLAYLKEGEEILTNKAIELEAKIHRELGEFNIGSPQQLCEKIYGIKIKRTKAAGVTLNYVDDYDSKKYAKVGLETPTGAPSTNDKALSKLHTPAAKLIQNYRGIMKLLSTYAIGYQKYVIDGRIYPTFNNSSRESYQYGTVTGRLSSSAPNMQNISREETEGWWLRKAIHASDGYDLIVADESQLEVRLLAHFSQDKNLVSAIKSGIDVHTATAKIIYKKEEISKEERTFAKTMNFAISYGQGIQAMAELLKTTPQKAKIFRFEYFNTFPGVKSWVTWIGNQVAHPENLDHHVTTVIGRKRRIPEVVDEDTGMVARAKRQAVNSIIQGSASDILKAAMVNIYKEFKEKGLDAYILLQIHDELVLESRKDHTKEAVQIVKKHMEKPLSKELLVPLKVDPIVCYNWGEGKN